MNERIVINLDQTDTKAYKPENLIQADAQKSFEELIEKFLSDIETKKNEEQASKDRNKIDRVHNAILINGKRGMGKTSFILSIEDADSSITKEKILNEICSLGVIDPTLIETREHIFLNIITLIKDKVDETIKCGQCDATDLKYKVWKESLKKLAGGLSMLDGVGTNHLNDSMWDSPELILEKGLSNTKQGVDLEKNFHNFIDESLKIIDKKEAFFLILDDIDTSLNKGIDILETLRKYLTSRKLIIAMLGDIDLYSILVRQLQWEKMDSKKILKEYEGKKKYLGQIEHLEEQYLTKVLKPENRINLKNLFDLKNELLITEEHVNLLEKRKKGKLDEESQNRLDDLEQSKNKRLQVGLSNKMETQELEKCVIDMVEKIYLTQNSGYTKYYERTLLTQSTRSVLQILQTWIHDRKLNENFISRIRHTFYTTIKNKLESHNLLEVPQEEQFLNLLSMYVMKENISRDNHLKLIPEFTEDNNNIVMLYINAMSNNVLNPNDYLAYFIKIGYALEQFLNIDTKVENELEKFIDHIALDSGESSSKIAKRLISTSHIHTNIHQSPILLGSIFINQNNLKLIDKKENIPLLLSKVNGSAFGQYNFLSFFNLLGFIADITSNPENAEKIIFDSEQILEFVLYKDINYAVEIDGEVDGDDNNFLIQEEIIEELYEWITHAEKIQKLPLFVLSKIWIRILYTFSNISKNKFENYYQVLEMFIVGFLNAIYVEISLYNKTNKQDLNKSFMKNPDKTPTNYYQKIATYRASETNFTLYDYLSCCPLFKMEDDKFKYFTCTEKITFKVDFMRLNEEVQIDVLEALIKKYKVRKIDLQEYSKLDERQKDNFISNKFRNKTTEYFNIQKKKFEELLEFIK